MADDYFKDPTFMATYFAEEGRPSFTAEPEEIEGWKVKKACSIAEEDFNQSLAELGFDNRAAEKIKAKFSEASVNFINDPHIQNLAKQMLTLFEQAHQTDEKKQHTHLKVAELSTAIQLHLIISSERKSQEVDTTNKQRYENLEKESKKFEGIISQFDNEINSILELPDQHQYQETLAKLNEEKTELLNLDQSITKRKVELQSNLDAIPEAKRIIAISKQIIDHQVQHNYIDRQSEELSAKLTVASRSPRELSSLRRTIQTLQVRTDDLQHSVEIGNERLTRQKEELDKTLKEALKKAEREKSPEKTKELLGQIKDINQYLQINQDEYRQLRIDHSVVERANSALGPITARLDLMEARVSNRSHFLGDSSHALHESEDKHPGFDPSGDTLDVDEEEFNKSLRKPTMTEKVLGALKLRKEKEIKLLHPEDEPANTMQAMENIGKRLAALTPIAPKADREEVFAKKPISMPAPIARNNTRMMRDDSQSSPESSIPPSPTFSVSQKTSRSSSISSYGEDIPSPREAQELPSSDIEKSQRMQTIDSVPSSRDKENPDIGSRLIDELKNSSPTKTSKRTQTINDIATMPGPQLKTAEIHGIVDREKGKYLVINSNSLGGGRLYVIDVGSEGSKFNIKDKVVIERDGTNHKMTHIGQEQSRTNANHQQPSIKI